MYNSNYKPKLLYAIGTKRHDRRFFVNSDSQIHNILPGTVIGEKFTRPEAGNFHMQGHYPLKVIILLIIKILGS